MSVQVNLLPNTKQERLKAKRVRQMIIAGCFVAIAIAVAVPTILFFLRLALDLNLDSKQKNIDELKAKIKNTPNIENMLSVKDRLNQLPLLYSNRNQYSEFLTYMLSRVPQDVKLSTVELTDDGTMRILGESPSYELVEKFYESLRQANVSVNPDNIEPDADLQGLFTSMQLDDVDGASGAEVSFTISGVFSDDLVNGTVGNGQPNAAPGN